MKSVWPSMYWTGCESDRQSSETQPPLQTRLRPVHRPVHKLARDRIVTTLSCRQAQRRAPWPRC